MKAVTFSSFGPPEVLQVIELDKPKAGSGEIRVKVKVAGVLPVDYKIRSGSIPLAQKLTFPAVPGNEFAGVVDQVGEGVNQFAVGDEVLGFTFLNSYAEYLVVSADQVVHKPATMPWEIAGVFSGNGQGAHMVLKDLNIKEGDTLLIHAAAGGLGTFTVQLARLWGAAKIIGTASEENHDYLRSLGVIPVTYGDGLFERLHDIAPNGIDAALDFAGPDALRTSMEIVKDPNSIRTMVSFELAQQLGIPSLVPDRSAERLAELVEYYTEGKLKIYIRKVFTLDQAIEAHRELERGHGRGKVILAIS